MSIEFRGVDYSTSISFVGMYSDNTPMVKTPDFEEIVARADTMVLRADSLHMFVTAMFLVDSINDFDQTRRYFDGPVIKNLVLPYLPGARQDRINPTGDVLFTAKSIARMINERHFDRVIAADPHSPVMPSLIKNFSEYPLERVYDRLWKGYGGVIAPDKGARDRATAAQRVVGGELRYGGKVRDEATGRLTGFTVEDLTPGKHYIVVDDICDGGGTFVGLGHQIREAGAFADLFVTHGIFSKGTRDLKDYYKNIYTTDTRQLNTDRRTRVMKFNIVDDMVNY